MLLESVIDSKLPETKVSTSAGQDLLEAKDFPKAARMFELARKAEPLDSSGSSSWPGSTTSRGIATIRLMSFVSYADGRDDLEDRRRLAQLLVEASITRSGALCPRGLEIDVLGMGPSRLWVMHYWDKDNKAG